MAKRTTWSRHGPDGAEVPLERRDLGLSRHGKTTYSGSDSTRWRAWVRDMLGQTGLGLLAEIQRAACAILRDAGQRVPRELRIGPPLTALLDATASPPQTGVYFAARALEAAIRTRDELRAGRAENAVYWAIRAARKLVAANLKRSLERDTLSGRRSRSGASKGGKRDRKRPEAVVKLDDAYDQLRAGGRKEREAAGIVNRRLGSLALMGPGSVNAIRARARRRSKKAGRQPA